MDSRDRSKGDSLRKRAEKMLSQRPQDLRKTPVEDLKRLIHELDVHQIELDMQNDELRKAQAEIELSRAKYVDLYDFAPVGYFTLTATGRIEEANLRGARLLGVERTNLVNRDFRRFITPEFMSLFESHLLEVLASDSVQKCELKLTRKDGIPLHVSLESLSAKSGDGNPSRIRSAMSDITERNKAQMALRESEERCRYLSSELLIAQEKERRQISYNLHDNIWQTLEIIKSQLEHLFSREDEADWSTFDRKAKQLIPVIRDMIARVRSMQGDLWPSVLDDIGIVATLEWYCREFGKNHPSLSIEKNVGLAEDEVPAAAKIVIYRVMQEAMSNVAKHSQASHVSLSLIKSDHRLEFFVKDNGIGFDPEEAIVKRSPWGGLGLLSMKERTELSGGLFGVESAKGKGTTVRVSWPLNDRH